ncbi:hypothetical protein JXA12_01805 [Candidatus Woesearchaeota archaeon]|nr:hypothetical protein [Candidatus Woesearchaeota archaeon]
MRAHAWPTAFLCILLLSSPLVLASIDIETYSVGDGFSVTPGPESVSLCQCEPFADRLVITNIGRFASRYSLSFSSDLVTVSEAEFELLPGEAKTIYAFVQAPCNRELSETVTFTVRDLFGNAYSFEKTYDVVQCQNLEATLAVDADGPVKPCTPVTYEVLVKNTGVFTETYDVVFGRGGYEESFGTPYQTLIIPPGQSGVASSSLLLDCSRSGRFAIPFAVAARQNGLVAGLEHVLEVSPHYDFTVVVVPRDVCADEQSVIPVTITNEASFEDAYTLTLRSPSPSFYLRDSSLTLVPNASAETAIIISPDVEPGEASLSLIVADAVGGVVQVLNATIMVEECYGVSVNVDLQEDVRGCSGYAEFPVIVKNTGVVDEDVSLAVSGSPYASYDTPDLFLEPGEEALVMLVMDAPLNSSLDTTLTLTATVYGKQVTAEDSLGVSLVDEYACYRPALLDQRLRARYSDEAVLLTVRNDGVRAASYELGFEGSSFFALNASDAVVVLAPGESRTVSLLTYQDDSEPQPRYAGLFQAFVRSGDGEHVLVYEHEVEITMRSRGFSERLYAYFSAHPCQLVTLVLLFLLIIGILVLLARPDRPRRVNAELAVIILLLWLVAVIALLLVYGLPPLYEPVAPSDDPLTVVMAEDTSFSLNLSSYFADPDDDVLSFVVSEMDNVSVSLVNGKAWFTPDPDWSGSRRFRVTAYDGAGGVAESPRMSLQVVDRPEYDAWSLYVRYCGHVNLVLLLVVAVVIILLARPVQQREELREPPRPSKKKVALKEAGAARRAPEKKPVKKSSGTKRMPKRRLKKRKK